MDHRALAVIVGFVALIVAAIRLGISSPERLEDLFLLGLSVGFALGLIHAADFLGELMGTWAGNAPITRKSPGWMVALIGWIFLILLTLSAFHFD